MFCLHNEIDLKPTYASIENADWIVILCKACDQRVGTRVRLIDLVDQGIKFRYEREVLENPDFESPEP